MSLYLARHYGGSFTVLAVPLILATFGFNSLRQIGRSSGEGVGATAVLVPLLKAPEAIQTLLPALAFGAAFLSYWRLARNNELMILRTTGFSFWQVVLPWATMAFTLGLGALFIINPLSAICATRLTALNLEGSENRSVALSSNGIWLRGREPENFILHAQGTLSRQPIILKSPTVYLLTEEGGYKGRIDAATARLETYLWLLRDAWIHLPDHPPRWVQSFELVSDLDEAGLLDSVRKPQEFPVWKLPGYVALLERNGFPSRAHRLAYSAQLAIPPLMMAMTLVAALLRWRVRGRQSLAIQALLGLGACVLVFSARSLVEAMSLAGYLPAWLVSWSLVLIVTLFSLASLLHLEDG